MGMMQSVTLVDKGKLEHQSRPVPEPKPGQVLIKTRLAGICGSDVHAFHGLQPSLAYPCIMGHELMGTVEAAAGETTAFSPGQRVVIDPSFRCGTCELCRAGKENICDNLAVLGVHCDGGFAEYFVCDSAMLHPIPGELGDEAAVMAEPLSIVCHAADRVCGNADTALIIGAGPIGLAMLMFVRSRYRKIMVLEPLENRRESACSYGADLVLNPLDYPEGLEAVVMDRFGELPGIVFDAVSNSSSVLAAETLVKRGGEVVIIGLANAQTGFRLLPTLKKELTIRGTRMTGITAFPRVIDFLKGQDQNLWKHFITHFFPLDQFETGFDLAANHPELSIKVVIRCGK